MIDWNGFKPAAESCYPCDCVDSLIRKGKELESRLADLQWVTINSDDDLPKENSENIVWLSDTGYTEMGDFELYFESGRKWTHYLPISLPTASKPGTNPEPSGEGPNIMTCGGCKDEIDINFEGITCNGCGIELCMDCQSSGKCPECDFDLESEYVLF